MQYTTERGVTVNVRPIPLLLDEIRKATPMPAQPTYTEHLAGGVEQEVVISDEDARIWRERDPESWAEHAEKWAQFEQERDEAQSLLNDRLWQAVVRKAVDVDLPDDDSWIEDQKALGLTVPQKPNERRIHYIRTEVVGGMRDVLKMTAIANGSDLSEEALSFAEASFRDSLARSLTGGLADQGRPVADEPAGRADEGGKGMEAQAQ